MKRRTFLGAAGAAALIPLAPPAMAAALRSVRVETTATLPMVRPDWPVPDDPNQMFFLQRSTNRNTIVFAARFDASGRLAYPDAVDVYWRRYSDPGADKGKRKPLKPFERALAYGVDIARLPQPDQYAVNMKPLPQLKMLVLQTGPGQAQVLGNFGGRTARVIYAFAHVDESGLLPRVTDLSVHGILPAGEGAISEYYSVSGGQFRE